MNSKIVATEVNAFQNPATEKWTVQRLVWHEGDFVADRKIIAEGVDYTELNKWVVWGELTQ
jgi:hypothetical protein